MGLNEWFGIVGGIISIVAFIFSVWVWLKSDIKVRELRGVIQSSYDISGSVMWEMTQIPGEDDSVRLKRAERALGLVSAIHTLTSKYAEVASSRRRTDLDVLADRGILWTTDMIWDLESSGRIREVWLVTPDAEPDLSDPDIGVLVGRNIRRGTRYVYFVPADLGNLVEIRTSLLDNLGLTRASRLADRVTVIHINRMDEAGLFDHGNNVLYFENSPPSTILYALEEVVLNKVAKRGSLWQEQPKVVGEQLRRKLRGFVTAKAIEIRPDDATDSA